MLQLNIQKGKEATKTAEFQKDIVGIAACMQIITKAKKGCSKWSPKKNYFSYICYGVCKTVEELSA